MMSSPDLDFMDYMNGPSCIPGLSGRDLLHGTEGYNLDERRIPEHKQQLLDPTLHARVAFWLRPKIFSLNDIKMECKSNGISVTGNKKVLALRLAMKHLPSDVEEASEGDYTITKSSPNKHGGKRVKTTSGAASDAASSSSSAAKGTKSNENDTKKKRSLPDKAEKGDTKQAAVKKTKKSAAVKKVVEEINDKTKCKKCKVDDSFVNRCEGRNCNKVTLACECNDYCNDGVYKVGVSHCGCCERAYCHKCRMRYAGGCTSCVMMAE